MRLSTAPAVMVAGMGNSRFSACVCAASTTDGVRATVILTLAVPSDEAIFCVFGGQAP
jgi:hypothetical protein